MPTLPPWLKCPHLVYRTPSSMTVFHRFKIMFVALVFFTSFEPMTCNTFKVNRLSNLKLIPTYSPKSPFFSKRDGDNGPCPEIDVLCSGIRITILSFPGSNALGGGCCPTDYIC